MIGAPDTQTYPLMQAINGSRTKVYGWVNGGFNVSTSNKGGGANSPASYFLTPIASSAISRSCTSNVCQTRYRRPRGLGLPRGAAL